MTLSEDFKYRMQACIYNVKMTKKEKKEMKKSEKRAKKICDLSYKLLGERCKPFSSR